MYITTQKGDITDQDIIKIVEGDTELLVEKAEILGEYLAKELKNQNQELTTSQIRNFFTDVKKMEMNGFSKKEFVLLKPKLCYAAARSGAKKGTERLRDILISAIDAVGDNPERFENFCNFFEAILAYHRAAGGK